MTDSLREGFREEQDRKARERQLVLLGAVLADRELRLRIREAYFADARIGGAFQDLTTGATKTRIGLREVLGDLGLHEWDESSGSPLELLIEHVRLDARLAVIHRPILHAIENSELVRSRSAIEKAEALKHVERIVKEAHDMVTAPHANETKPPQSKANGSKARQQASQE